MSFNWNTGMMSIEQIQHIKQRLDELTHNITYLLCYVIITVYECLKKQMPQNQ